MNLRSLNASKPTPSASSWRERKNAVSSLVRMLVDLSNTATTTEESELFFVEDSETGSSAAFSLVFSMKIQAWECL